MANDFNDSVAVFGKDEKVKDFIDYVLSTKVGDFDKDKGFTSELFPLSITYVDISKNKIYITSRRENPNVEDLLKRFPDLGFIYHVFGEGFGEKIHYIVNDTILYSVYHNYEGLYQGKNAPDLWERTTGLKFNEDKIKAAFNLINDEDEVFQKR